MRKFVILMLMLVGLGQLSHAEDENFFAEGKYWLMERVYWGGRVSTYKMFVDDEVEVGEVTARRLRREWVDTGESELAYIGYENDGVVYLYLEADVYNYDQDCYVDISGFYPLLDFNAKVGEQLVVRDMYSPSFETRYQVVEDEDYINVNGINRRFQFFGDRYSTACVWIEGIGVARYTFSTTLLDVQMPSCGCEDNYSDYVVACYQGDECVYEASRLNEYLTGLSSLDDIAVDQESEPLYDLMGRRVAEPKAGQIYVTPSGKKFVKK